LRLRWGAHCAHYLPAARTVIRADVTDGARPLASLRWTATGGPDLDLRDPRVAPGGRGGVALALAPGALQAGASYTLTLQVTDALGRVGVAAVDVAVAVPPGGGYLKADPAGGEVGSRV